MSTFESNPKTTDPQTMTVLTDNGHTGRTQPSFLGLYQLFGSKFDARKREVTVWKLGHDLGELEGTGVASLRQELDGSTATQTAAFWQIF